MRRIVRPVFRYGEPDFDEDYMRWGLHDRETQVREAQAVLGLLRPASPLSILDLACGIGTHAIHFYLERHETDPETGRHEDAWITIDPERDLIEEKVSQGAGPVKNAALAHLLEEAGYQEVGLRTMEGEPFMGGEEPYWLWLVARR